MILREPSSTPIQPGPYLAFLVRIQTVDPSAFEMPDAPASEAGGFFFLRDICRMSANDPKRTLESGQFYTDFYRARAHAVADRTVSSKRPGIQSNFLTGTQPGVRYPRSEAYRAKGDVMQLPKIFRENR